MPHAYVHSRPPEPVLGSDGSFSSELGPFSGGSSLALPGEECRSRPDHLLASVSRGYIRDTGRVRQRKREREPEREQESKRASSGAAAGLSVGFFTRKASLAETGRRPG